MQNHYNVICKKQYLYSLELKILSWFCYLVFVKPMEVMDEGKMFQIRLTTTFTKTQVGWRTKYCSMFFDESTTEAITCTFQGQEIDASHHDTNTFN